MSVPYDAGEPVKNLTVGQLAGVIAAAVAEGIRRIACDPDQLRAIQAAADQLDGE